MPCPSEKLPRRASSPAFCHDPRPLGSLAAPRRDIKIRDTAPVILRAQDRAQNRAYDGVELTERVWAPRSANKKPVFTFRSEKRDFGKSTRCLIPASHFFEFTAPADPKQKRKDSKDK
jgi:putative SOS response-associated peptidase YedK